MADAELDLSKATFSNDDDLTQLDVAALEVGHTLSDGSVVTSRSENGAVTGYTVHDADGSELESFLVSVAPQSPQARAPRFIWLCYETPDGGQHCVRVKSNSLQVHEAYGN